MTPSTTRAIEVFERQAPTYPGDAILFRATDLSDFPGVRIDRDLGWRRLIKGNLEIVDLPGNHLGILRPPNVHIMAAAMRRNLLAYLERNIPA